MLALGVVIGACGESPPRASSAVSLGANGKLAYTADAQGNVIPDFSQCGYRAGAARIPDVPVRETVQPVSGDAGAVIQAALDKVAVLEPDASGFRGAVLLRRGKYSIAGSLVIKADGVVLRGEGQGDDGTILIAAGKGQRTLIQVGTASKTREIKGTRQPVADAYVPVGAHSLHVESAAGFQPGDRVIVHRPSTKEWIHDLHMDHFPPRKDNVKVEPWKPGSKDLHFERVVTAVKGNELHLDAPITDALDKKYGGGSVYKADFPGRIRQVGVENLHGVSEYRGATDEDHGWTLISLKGVENGWVRQVTSLHFGYGCVHIEHGSKWVTVQHCSCLDPVSELIGGRRYSFLIDGQLSLVEHCHARNGRHDFVTGSTVVGPNVFVDCKAEKAHADSGPHHRWAVGVLYDNVQTSGDLNVRDRGNLGSGHGWAGANHVFWNCTAAQIICERPPTANNWAIGCVAGKHHGNGTWESLGKHVQPASLYRAQVAERRARTESDARP
jgi:hypothetical protein